MDKIKCLIVDDEPVAQRILEGYLSDLPAFVLVGKCNNALEARDVLLNQSVDLMLLDLEMPKLKGFAFLKTLVHPPAVIITTAHREFALEGYEFDVLDYLLKPISFERFLKAVNRYQKKHMPIESAKAPALNKRSYILVTSERKNWRLEQDDISHIEGMNNYVKIHTSERIHLVYTSLQHLQRELGSQFVRVHKSYIINRHWVKAFTKDIVEVGDRSIPIGQTYKTVVDTFTS